MASKKSFAACQVERLEEALAGNIGATSITVDGMTFSLADRDQLIRELDYWRKRWRKEQGRGGPRVNHIRLYGTPS